MVLVGHWIAFMGDTPGITLNSVDVQKGQARTSHPVASPFEKTAHLSLGSVTSNLSIVSTVPLLFIPYNLTALHSTSRPFEASNKPPKHPKNSAESMFDLLGSQMSSPTCQEGLASFGQSFQTHG